MSPPSFPYVGHEQAGQQKVHGTHQLEHQIRHHRRDHAEHDLIARLGRRSRRVGHHEECEEQRGVQVRLAIQLGHPRRIAHECGEREQQEVHTKERQHRRHFVHAIGDEHARGEQSGERNDRQLRQCAPPALAGVEGEVADHQRQRRRIEHIRRTAARHVLAEHTDRGRHGGDLP